MGAKRDRPEGQTLSPNKRQKSDDSTPNFPKQYTVHLVKNPDKYKQKKNETEPLPLVGGLDHNLDKFYYTVSPLYWNELRKYGKFSIADQTFATGDTVLVKSPLQEADPNLVDSLRYSWVGKVMECRAFSEAYVFVRILWFNRPEDLECGRQPYHGMHEVVATNSSDIIDANTINGPVTVRFWDEDDDDDNPHEGALFYRVSVDTTAIPNTYSGMRPQCSCKQPANPDNLLLQCSNSTCAIWLHDECLVKDLASMLVDTVTTAGAESTASPTTKKGKAQKVKPANRTSTKDEPYTVKRLVDHKPPNGMTGSAKPELERDPPIFRITPADKSRRPFTVGIELDQKGHSQFISSDRPGYSAKKPWRQEIKCLSCKTVIR